MYPASTTLPHSSGIFRMGKTFPAQEAFQVIAHQEPDFMPARKELENMWATMVPRWHFRMLNDKIRNDAYKQAIMSCGVEFDKIVDVGAGCGLLSLLAASKPLVRKITAIEESDVMCTIAQTVCGLNAVSDKVKIINKSTRQVSVKEIDANLLVTEIFDIALFGEHMLDTLMYAMHFVMKNGQKWDIIPAKATVYVTGIASNAVMRKHRILRDVPAIGLVDLCVTSILTEPYEGENLNLLDVLYATETAVAGEVDFKDYESLMALFATGDFCPKLSLKCKTDGFIDAFAVWFDLHLNESTMISTNPHTGGVKCWEQAVFYQDHGIVVSEDETINLGVRIVDGCMKIALVDETIDCKMCFKASQDVVLLLNDANYLEQVTLLAGKLQCSENTTVFDNSPFPVFGLLMGLKGAKVRCVAATPEDQGFFLYMFARNNVEEIEILLGEPDPDQKRSLIDNSDYYFNHPIQRAGIPDEEFFSGNFLQSLGSSGGRNVTHVPNKVRLMLQVIECDYIYYYNKLDDKNVFNLRIAEVLNKYMTDQHLLFKNNIPYRALTKTVPCLNLMGTMELTHKIVLPAITCGNASAVLYWFEMDLLDQAVIDTSKCSYFNHACLILREPVHVCENTGVIVSIRFQNGLIGLTEFSSPGAQVSHQF